VEVFGEGFGERLRKIERLDVARFAAEREDAFEQERAARNIAENGVFGDRDQLQRVAALETQRVERGAPRQAVEALRQPVGERQPLVAAETDQAAAFVDPVGGGIG
jgi:hypothetical protein